MDESLPPAAWYQDPEHAGALRWWDGQQWTEYRHHAYPPATPPLPSPADPGPYATAAVPPRPAPNLGQHEYQQATSAPSARLALAPSARARPFYRKKRVLLPAAAVVAITAAVANSNSSHTQSAAAQSAGTTVAVTPTDPAASATLPTEPPHTTAPIHTTAPTGPASPLTAQQYALLYKDPDASKGQRYVLYGEVTQFDSATGPAAFIANVGPARDPITGGATSYVDNSEFVGDAALLKDVVEHDVFSATIKVLGSDTYDTQTGGQTTVPKYQVLSISVYGSTR